ncbi:inositol polyphosphate 1-phosphatase [Neocloeon triangulifer]|uniref:inositol polyphosphate 1-phosphatase n=1 Tax=Neocloeon triangulifer TaxID=2078957 RepID=UPI00286F3303|nr:inositol polyphosphate 1-phosphatase [Neocloeon triangulifer]XP_059490743.1 inositol polyphosphate 1-phosphatase [Neocloeon triangulifer]
MLANMKSFLQAIINVSEKAANIARACRREAQLFRLLVQEKSNEDKNQRFVHDFKTLADVLIQETVKNELGTKFPELIGFIQGEESNLFTNTLGETIEVKVMITQEDTAELLCKVLDGDKSAADLLALEVHRDVTVESDIPNELNDTNNLLPMDTIGIWIDPIDSTAEYIQGAECSPNSHGIFTSGLRCATVLIGAYNRKTGEPMIGVVNQPFFQEEAENWRGTYFWGVSCEGAVRNSFGEHPSPTNVALLSGSETESLKESLGKHFELVEAAGAGYKQLCIAQGSADVYVLSRGSTYRWDSCAPHAILKSLGGGVIRYCEVVEKLPSVMAFKGNFEDKYGVRYHQQGRKGWCNEEGLIAYANQTNLLRLLSCL